MSESTALSLLGTRDELAALFAPNTKYLPAFKIFYPIEATKFTGVACLVHSDETVQLKAPYRIGVVHARRAARRLVIGEAWAGRDTDELFVELSAAAKMEGDRSVELGQSCCLAIFMPDNKVALAIADNFKTMAGYWRKVLGNAILANGAVVRIDVTDHMPNMKAAKDDETRKFFASEKFTQWEQEEVSAKQMELLEAVMTEKREVIESWLAK